MDRRKFLALCAGSLLWPGVAQETEWRPHTVTITYGDVASEKSGWVEITPQDFDGRLWRHHETGKLFSVSKTHGWSITHGV